MSNEITEPMTTNFSNIISEIYDNLRTIVVDKKVTYGNILILTTQCMELVEKYVELSGLEKHKIVVEVVKRLVTETKLSEAELENINQVVENLVPVAINLIIAASKGKFALNLINKVKKKSKLCCR